MKGRKRKAETVNCVEEEEIEETRARSKTRLKGVSLRALEKCGKQLEGQEGTEVIQGLSEQLLRVRTREGGIAPLKLNAVQRAFELRRGKHNIVLKARQVGLTTWAAGRFFLRTITQPGTLTVEVAHTQQAAEEIFHIVHRFYRWLPEELKKKALDTSQMNLRQIAFPKLDSEFRVMTAGDRNAGRGLTIQNLHCSELARWPGNPAETLAGLRASLTPQAEVILESTPMGACGCFYEEWQRAEETRTVRHFFPWWMEARYVAEPVDPATLTEEEKKLAARECLSLEQIGFRRRIRASFQGLARQEYAEDPDSCFLASGESIFEIEVVDRLLADMREPWERRDNGELEIWFPPVREGKYVVSLDPAGGGSQGDYSAMEVLEMATGLQCAEYASHLGGLELARYASQLAREYNDAWLVVERNSLGSGVLAYLEASFNYGRIYHQDGRPGWLTTSANRPAAINLLGVTLVESPAIFQSRRLMGECRTFVRLPDGGTGAAPGAHDDRVMAMAIGLSARVELLEKRIVQL